MAAQLPDPMVVPAARPANGTPRDTLVSTEQALQTAAAVDAQEAGQETVKPPFALERPNNLWERIRFGFRMSELDSALIAEHEAWYAARPDYVRRMVERSKRYLYHIVEEVEKRGMPTEVALLPMIESAFNPKAYSRSHASGIWQFVPATGKTFGLQQNNWYDARRDILAATDAALDYLEKLYGMFGSWELALAAYNWGEGSVQRAIAKAEARGEPTDYLNLKMPPETRNYVPKLMAVKNIVMNPENYGLNLDTIPNEPYFATVATKKRMDVRVAAKLAGVPVDEFVSLNPGYNRPIITGDTKLLLPVGRVDAFSDNLENYTEPLVSWQSYTPRRGEKIETVARKFGTTAARLREVNGLTGPRPVVAGKALLVPVHAHEPASNVFAVNYQEPEAPPAPIKLGKAVHVVKRGETIFSIAQHYDVSAQQLRSWNRLRNNRIALGQKITVRQGQAAEAQRGIAGKPGKSEVAKAEPVGKNAKEARLSPKEAKLAKLAAAKEAKQAKLAAAREAKSAKLAAAREAKSAKGGKTAVAKAGGKGQAGKRMSYTVRRGDTVDSIARKFNVAANDIQRWNNLKRPLQPGAKVTLYQGKDS